MLELTDIPRHYTCAMSPKVTNLLMISSLFTGMAVKETSNLISSIEGDEKLENIDGNTAQGSEHP